jgi:hypothetical protein
VKTAVASCCIEHKDRAGRVVRVARHGVLDAARNTSEGREVYDRIRVRHGGVEASTSRIEPSTSLTSRPSRFECELVEKLSRTTTSSTTSTLNR